MLRSLNTLARIFGLRVLLIFGGFSLLAYLWTWIDRYFSVRNSGEFFQLLYSIIAVYCLIQLSKAADRLLPLIPTPVMSGIGMNFAFYGFAAATNGISFWTPFVSLMWGMGMFAVVCLVRLLVSGVLKLMPKKSEPGSPKV
jgi:hypothetical protein